MNIEYSIDAVRHTNSELPIEISSEIKNYYSNIDDLSFVYDVMFITNPTSMHEETIKKVIQYTKHMFIEKPIFMEPVNDIEQLGLKSNCMYYVAAPLRHGSVITKIKEMIENEKIFSVRAISSSYLPEWRPNIDYRINYSAKKDMGGGVALDIIHELDYLTFLFGMPKECKYFGGKFSNLEIDSDDLATYLLKYDDKLIELHLDYFGRETVRKIELYCNDYRIEGDLVNNSVKKIYSNYVETIFIPEDQDFQNEMKYFLSLIMGKEENMNTIEHVNEVLRLALGGK